jgi:hypothetical protein
MLCNKLYTFVKPEMADAMRSLFQTKHIPVNDSMFFEDLKR